MCRGPLPGTRSAYRSVTGLINPRKPLHQFGIKGLDCGSQVVGQLLELHALGDHSYAAAEAPSQLLQYGMTFQLLGGFGGEKSRPSSDLPKGVPCLFDSRTYLGRCICGFRLRHKGSLFLLALIQYSNTHCQGGILQCRAPEG